LVARISLVDAAGLELLDGLHVHTHKAHEQPTVEGGEWQAVRSEDHE